MINPNSSPLSCYKPSKKGRLKLDIERCHREIAAIDVLIGAGHPDLQGLCLALSDWCAELRLIEGEMDHKTKKAAAAEAEAGGGVRRGS
jgi:hypothetical protein